MSFNRIFETIADYDKMELSFTEDELLYYYNLNDALAEVEPVEELGFDTDMNRMYLDSWYLEALRLLPGEPYAHPVQNINGGVTAMVEAFAAINANTSHPEAAFKVIELLFSEEIQSGNGFEEAGGSWLCPESFYYNSIAGVATGKAAYRDPVLYAEGFLDSLNEKITNVRFTSNLDKVLYDLAMDTAYGSGNVEKAVSECYSDMKMMISE